MKITKIIFIFILFSFLGWWLELFNEIIFFKKINPNYSYLLGKNKYKIPLMPVYGVGIFILYFIAINYFKNERNLICIFITVTAIITLFELLIGIVSEIIFKKRGWDYSKYSPYHFLGYIDVYHSLAWGIIATLMIYTILYLDIKYNI